MLLLIDNFDSFTYNIVQCFHMLSIKTIVVKGQSKSAQECLSLCPQYIVIGPGPGSPQEASLSRDLIKTSAGHIPLLGVCLGHQALAAVWGGSVIRAAYPMHGKCSHIEHNNKGIFRNIPQSFLVARYHSLIVDELALPPCLEVTARAESHEIMGLRHKIFDQQSIQFHPESIASEYGMTLLENFIRGEIHSE